MRPRNYVLRQDYKKAAEELLAQKKPVNSYTLSEQLGKKYDAVRTFFSRNRSFAASIGVTISTHRHAVEYFAAREKLLRQGKKATSRAVAGELGMDHTSVCRFFKRRVSPLSAEELTAIETVLNDSSLCVLPELENTSRMLGITCQKLFEYAFAEKATAPFSRASFVRYMTTPSADKTLPRAVEQYCSRPHNRARGLLVRQGVCMGCKFDPKRRGGLLFAYELMYSNKP